MVGRRRSFAHPLMLAVAVLVAQLGADLGAAIVPFRALARKARPIGAQPPARQADAGRDLIVTTAWLGERLGDPAVVVVATGDRAEFDDGHIPGARFIGHDETLGADHRLLDTPALVAALARAGARDDARVVIYSDEPMAAGWLYMAFAAVGHGDHVSLLSGNIAAWREDGRPVSRDAAPPARSRLTPRPSRDVIVEAPWVRDRLKTPGVRVIDARSTREWDRGRLPGARLVLWQDLFVNQTTRRFKSREDIRSLLAGAGVAPTDQVVTYCAIGMRASLMYLAARYAGYDCRVYVGSWQDWTRQSGYPIDRGGAGPA
jgi:thiosulfate/3-mercaptopyruvate sulfurtransferase